MAVRRQDQGESQFPSVRVDVIEAGARTRPGRIGFEIDSDLKFSTSQLESYCLAQWEPVVFDTFVVAAAVEFCDRIQRRPTQHWGRNIELRIPVHEPDRWGSPSVTNTLHDALAFLTGDRWAIAFVGRQRPLTVPRQIPLEISGDVSAVIPFSDGLDSRAVAGLMGREMGDRLVRVRMGSKPFNAAPDVSGKKQPFTSIPYRLKPRNIPFVESSGRSRGFKFSIVGGLAAYLIKADRVIMPESGQGSLGPALVPVGQTYDDYRNHPLFTDRMERLLAALFGRRICFEFPRLWHTKGETLAAFANNCADGHTWKDTWSCWQQNRQASVDGRRRQCGICAACMLRRLSIHAAGLDEPGETYVWENLRAPTFEAGAASGFMGITGAQREYAIAGTLHLAHLAALRRSAINATTLDLAVSQLSRSRALPEATIRAKLDRLLDQHESEWKRFLATLGPDSFVGDWAVQL